MQPLTKYYLSMQAIITTSISSESPNITIVNTEMVLTIDMGSGGGQGKIFQRDGMNK